MDEKRIKKNKKISTVITLLLVIMAAIGISFAYWDFTPENMSALYGSVTAPTYDSLIFAGEDISFSGTLGDSTVNELKVTNTTNVSMEYSLSLYIDKNTFIPTGSGDDISIDVNMPNDLESVHGGKIENMRLVMPEENSENVVILRAIIGPNETQTFTTTVSLNDTGDVQNVNIGKKIEAHYIASDVKTSTFRIEPKLVDNLIPVIYDEPSHSWLKASADDREWFNYSDQIWANAVTVKNSVRGTYNNADAGTTIPMDDILGMFVWIPRFEYKIEGDFGKGGISRDLPGEIEVHFISSKQQATENNFIIHPAFIDGSKNNYVYGGWDSEIDGFWYGKFETGAVVVGKNYFPAIIPNIHPISGYDIIQEFDLSLGISTDYYNLNLDSHMSKNDEWGAVAYLTQSLFGKYGNPIYEGANKEVYINNYSGFITGVSAGDPSSDVSSDITCRYDDIENRGSGIGSCGGGASTTGNIYGIYDMNGGSWEYVMANYEGNIGEVNIITADDLAMFPHKYYNIYSGDVDTACNDGICYGHAINETAHANNRAWYHDYYSMINKDKPWLSRGGGNTTSTSAGLFYFSTNTGAGSANAFRTVLT